MMNEWLKGIILRQCFEIFKIALTSCFVLLNEPSLSNWMSQHDLDGKLSMKISNLSRIFRRGRVASGGYGIEREDD